MKIGYFGSPAMSARLLSALLDQGEHSVEFVVSNADRPRGRSKKPIPTEVSQLAEERGLPLFRFPSLKGDEIPELLARHPADIYLVFAYGKLIPERIFNIPGQKTINLHGSLLPDLRGASPIETAILRGYRHTGWTVQYITREMDAGDVIARREVEITEDETAGELIERMVPAGIELIMEVLTGLPENKFKRLPQDPEKATFCSRIEPEMGIIDWKQSARVIHNLVRAYNPRPVARSSLDGHRFYIHRTGLPTDTSEQNDLPDIENQLKERPPGAVLTLKQGKQKRLLVKTGEGFLEIVEIQAENKKIMKTADFLNGFRPTPDAIFI